jgi:hypothetical protein
MSLSENGLSVEDAVSALQDAPRVDDAPEGDEPTENADNEPEREEDAHEAEPDFADPDAEDSAGPEEATDAEDEAQNEAEQPPIDPPLSWDAEAKAQFEQLPRDLQQKVVEREKQRDAALSKAQQDAAEARKAVEAAKAESQKITDIAERASKTFRDRWEGIDWQAWAQKEPDIAQKAWTQYQIEERQLAEASAAAERSRAESHAKFVQSETAKLAEKAPEFMDPEKGPELKQKVQRFLMEQHGFSADDLNNVTASQVLVAYDAMRYGEAKKALKSKPEPKPQDRKPVKPTAGSAVSPKKQSLKARESQLGKTGKVDDAVALLQARRGS